MTKKSQPPRGIDQSSTLPNAGNRLQATLTCTVPHRRLGHLGWWTTITYKEGSHKGAIERSEQFKLKDSGDGIGIPKKKGQVTFWIIHYCSRTQDEAEALYATLPTLTIPANVDERP